MLRFVSVFALALFLSGCGASLKDFESKEHKFKVQMPGTPTTKKQKAGLADQTIYIVEERNGAYSVFHQENPGSVEGAEKFLFELVKEGLKSQGTIKNTKDIKLDGKYPGLEITMEVTNPKGGEMRNRMYLVNSKL